MALNSTRELDELKQKLLRMAAHAETSVRHAIQALVDRDDALALRVREEEAVLDQFEVQLDEQSIHLLTQAPAPADLRFIAVGMKISHDLERVGDEATTIAGRALALNQEPPLQPRVDIPRMANLALQMLTDAIGSFLDRDPGRARAVIPRDKEVDALNKHLNRELANGMVERPATITRALHLIVISKSLERIADHATNIAEEVVYLCEGEDIRHPSERSSEVPPVPAAGPHPE